MGGGDIGHVEGRVLTHQHDIDAAEVQDLPRAQREMIAVDPAHRQRTGMGDDRTVPETEIVRQIMEQRMTAPRGFQRQRKGAVAVDVDCIDRIHLDRDGKAHRGLLIVGCAVVG